MAHRFHVDAIGSADEVRLSAETVRHLRVLGLGEGSEVVLFDGSGVEAAARIESLAHADTRARILERTRTTRPDPSGLAVTLAVACPKGRRMDVLVRMCAELGVREIVPLITRRSVVKLHAEAPSNKLKRWRKICAAAGEQSGRTHLTTVSAPADFEDLLDSLASARDRRMEVFDLAVILSPLPSTGTLVETLRANPSARSLLLLVGPEGGWTPEELSLATSRGAVTASLTSSVLRVETACVAAVALAVVLSSH